MTIELHTHRHVTPPSAAAAQSELAENRRQIVRLTGREPRHFCYPSGHCDGWCREWIESAGVRSATTTDPGLDYPSTPRLQLNRFNDGEAVPQPTIEAAKVSVTE